MTGGSVAAVLFDLDGTLLDSIDGILSSFHHVLDTFVGDHDWTRPGLVNLIGEPVIAQMRRFAPGDEALAARMQAAYREHNARLQPHFPLYPGVHSVLTELRRRGFPTGLVTSKGRAAAEVSLGAHALGPLFDVVLTAEDTTRHKPGPEPLLEAARRLALAPASIMYVGDSVHDIRCAQSAGAMAVAALWGPFPAADLAALRPAYQVSVLTDLLQLPILRQSAVAEMAGRAPTPSTEGR